MWGCFAYVSVVGCRESVIVSVGLVTVLVTVLGFSRLVVQVAVVGCRESVKVSVGLVTVLVLGFRRLVVRVAVVRVIVAVVSLSVRVSTWLTSAVAGSGSILCRRFACLMAAVLRISSSGTLTHTECRSLTGPT